MSNPYVARKGTVDVNSSDSVDVNQFLSRVLGMMGLNLVVMAAVAFFIGSQPELLKSLFKDHGTATLIGSVVAVFGLMFAMFGAVAARKGGLAMFFLFAFSAAFGILFAPITVIYTGASLFKVFAITCAVFGSAALYGLTTKRDLTGLNAFLFMILMGLVIGGAVNLFTQSTTADYVMSGIGVVLFTVMTAVDIQNSREIYYAEGGSWGSVAICACNMMLNFLNLFLDLLRILGELVGEAG